MIYAGHAPPHDIARDANATSEATTNEHDEDMLYGVPAIAESFRWRARQVYHLKGKHGLPTYKIGLTVCASRRAIRAWVSEREATTKVA